MNKDQPAAENTYEVVIPISQLRWRMSQLSQAGVPYGYDVNGPQVTISVPVAHVEAAQDAIGGEPAERKRKMSNLMGYVGTIWFGGIALVLMFFVPMAAIFAAVGAGVFFLFHLVENGQNEAAIRKARKTGRMPMGMVWGSRLLEGFSIILIIVILAMVAGALASARLGVPLNIP